MTLLGKILTVCILIAAIFLMFFGMTVYGLHRNWKADYEALNTRLTKANADNAALTSKYEEQIAQLNADKEVYEQEVRKLETARVEVMDLNKTVQNEVDELRGERRQAVATVAATEQNNARLTDEVVALRKTTQDAQQARDAAFNKTLDATSMLHNVVQELASVKERSAQLLTQLAHYKSSLLENNVDPDADVVTRAGGQVTSTRRADGNQLIEISIGYDDGIRPRQTVEVFRGDRYLGRAEILKVEPDRAVGRILKEFQQGQIQQGDNVATKLAGGQ
jgi:hypothetical protein